VKGHFVRKERNYWVHTWNCYECGGYEVRLAGPKAPPPPGWESRLYELDLVVLMFCPWCSKKRWFPCDAQNPVCVNSSSKRSVICG
jgi:hypothetical protein